MLFDIDWQGAGAIAAAAPDDTVRVFILPPSMADLVAPPARPRPGRRRRDPPAAGPRQGEIEQWGEYDYVIVNDDFDLAYAELAHIYHAERLRRARNPWLAPFVAGSGCRTRSTADLGRASDADRAITMPRRREVRPTTLETFERAGGGVSSVEEVSLDLANTLRQDDESCATGTVS